MVRPGKWGTEPMSNGKARPRLLRFWPRLLFLVPFVAMLWVASYNRTAPALGGIPFFYWYQLLWVLIRAGGWFDGVIALVTRG